MSLSHLDTVLWASSFIGHLVLVAVLILRGRWRRHFWFTFSIASMAFQTVLLFLLYRLGTTHEYFIAYWTTGFLTFPVDCLVVAEVARIQLAPLWTVLRDSQRRFWGLWLFIVGTFAIVSLGIGMGNAQGFDLWENRISVFTSLVLVSVLLFLRLILTRYYVVPRRHAAAVAEGYFALQYALLVSDVVKAFLHLEKDPALIQYGQEFLYLGVLTFWIIVFLRGEKQLPPPPPEMLKLMSAMHEKVKRDLEGFESEDQ